MIICNCKVWYSDQVLIKFTPTHCSRKTVQDKIKTIQLQHNELDILLASKILLLTLLWPIFSLASSPGLSVAHKAFLSPLPPYHCDKDRNLCRMGRLGKRDCEVEYRRRYCVASIYVYTGGAVFTEGWSLMSCLAEFARRTEGTWNGTQLVGFWPGNNLSSHFTCRHLKMLIEMSRDLRYCLRIPVFYVGFSNLA